MQFLKQEFTLPEMKELTILGHTYTSTVNEEGEDTIIIPTDRGDLILTLHTKGLQDYNYMYEAVLGKDHFIWGTYSQLMRCLPMILTNTLKE